MFIPGETIIHNFVIPFDTTKIANVIVTYKQNGQVVLMKTVAAEAYGPQSQVTIHLTQDESLLFRDETSFLVQLNVIMTDGSRCASRELKGISGIQHLRKKVTQNV